MSYRERLEEMVALVEAYPLCTVIEPAQFQPGLARGEARELAKRAGYVLSDALADFYESTNGFTFFWRVPEGPSALIEAYNASPGEHATRINWEMRHGILIAPLERMLSRDVYPEPLMIGGDASTLSAKDIFAFDRFLARGNEDGCTGIVMGTGAEERVLAITDSGVVDRQRPWMTVTDYLDLVIAMAGENGSRYDLSMGSGGQVHFTADEIAGFRRDIFRPLS